MVLKQSIVYTPGPEQGLDQVFFTMCGSTAVDTALKIALAYHK